jgi:hypothetical protein
VTPKSEPYVQYPRRFGQALFRGEMNSRVYSVGCFLCDAADYRTGLYVGTLAAIADGMQWEFSHDTLTRSLARLKEGGWIDFESTKGQRKPYEIRLTGLLVRPQPTQDLRSNTPSLALVSYAETSDDPPAIPDGERDSPPHELTQPISAPSTSSSVEGVDLLGRGDLGEGQVSFSLDGLDPDVRERVGKARAARPSKGAGVDFDNFGTARPVCGTCGAVEFFAHNVRCKACGMERSA